MQFLIVIGSLILAYFLLTAIGGLFIATIGFFIDNFLMAFLGLGVLVFIFSKK